MMAIINSIRVYCCLYDHICVSTVHMVLTFFSDNNDLQIRNTDKNMCADASAEPNAMNKPIIGYPCHKQGGNQVRK